MARKEGVHSDSGARYNKSRRRLASSSASASDSMSFVTSGYYDKNDIRNARDLMKTKHGWQNINELLDKYDKEIADTSDSHLLDILHYNSYVLQGALSKKKTILNPTDWKDYNTKKDTAIKAKAQKRWGNIESTDKNDPRRRTAYKLSDSRAYIKGGDKPKPFIVGDRDRDRDSGGSSKYSYSSSSQASKKSKGKGKRADRGSQASSRSKGKGKHSDSGNFDPSTTIIRP